MPGGRPRSVTDDEIVEAVETAPDPVLTAAEISDRVDLGTRSVRDRLRPIIDDGRVVTKDVGGSRIYYSPDLIGYRAYVLDRREQREDAPAGRQQLAELVDGLELPGEGQLLQQRRDAVLAAVSTIRELGVARRGDVLDAIHPEHAAGYESAISLWKNTIQPALGELVDDVPELVIEAGRWRWREDDAPAP